MENTVIEDSDVYWEMRWGDYKKQDGSPAHPASPFFYWMSVISHRNRQKD